MNIDEQFCKLERVLKATANNCCVKNKIIIPGITSDSKLCYLDEKGVVETIVLEQENIEDTLKGVEETFYLCDHAFLEGFQIGVREVLKMLKAHKEIIESDPSQTIYERGKVSALDTNIECLEDYFSERYTEGTYIHTDIFLSDNKNNIAENGVLKNDDSEYAYREFDLTASGDCKQFDSSDVMKSYNDFIEKNIKR